MAIPDFQALMLPMLRFAVDDSEHSMLDVRTTLADQMGLTDEDRQELCPAVSRRDSATASLGRRFILNARDSSTRREGPTLSLRSADDRF